MPYKYYNYLALFLTVFTLFARLSDVGSNPAGFYCDEAAISFNARSILETGKDEHGISYPFYFKSYGDYKSGLYVYSVAIAQKIFGNDTAELVHFTTRLPAALFLALVLPLGYIILAKSIHPLCGLIALLLLATDPWLHHFSHIGFSLTAIPFLLAAGLCLWLIGIKEKDSFYFALSAAFYSLAFYTYAPARLFVPLFAAGLLIIYAKDQRIHRKDLFAFVLTACLCSLPFFYYLLGVEDYLKRVGYLNIFTTPYLASSGGYRWYAQHTPELWQSIQTLPQFVSSLLVFIWNYFQQLSLDFLFFNSGPNLKFGPTKSGVLQLLSLPGLAAGVFFAIKDRSRFGLILLWWILIFPIPGSLTWEDIPHAGRAIVAHPGLTLLAAFGYWRIFTFLANLKNSYLRKVSISLLILSTSFIYLYQSYLFLKHYHENYSIRSSAWMQYGIREIVDYVREHSSNFREVQFVTTGLLYEPEMHILMYSGIPAKKWHETHKLPYKMKVLRKTVDVNYLRPNTLYIISPPPRHIPPSVRVLHTVFWEDNVGASAVFLRLKQENINLK